MATKRMPARKTVSAMAVADDGSIESTRRRSSSFAAVLTDLAVGETAARVQPVDPGLTLEEYGEQFVELREALRNNCSPAVRQAKARNGGEYSIEIADVMTQSRKLFLVALVTRTA